MRSSASAVSGSSVGSASDSKGRGLGFEPVLGTWLWGLIPPKELYQKAIDLAATSLLAEW